MSVLNDLIDEACRCATCKAKPQDCTCFVRVACSRCGECRLFVDTVDAFVRDFSDFDARATGERAVTLDGCPDCREVA
jgi:hypothetical protein